MAERPATVRKMEMPSCANQHSALSKGKPVPGSIGKGPSVSHIASVQTRFRELETRNLKLETLPQKPGTPSFRPSLAKGWDQDVDASNKPPGRKGFQRATICVSSQVGCAVRSEEHTSELQSRQYLVCR